MADLSSTAITTAATDQQDHRQQPDNPPILSFFSNFLKLFNSPLPFLPPHAPAKKKQLEEPTVVTFPRPSSEESLRSLKLQAEDQIQERNPNPVILWQVFFLIPFLDNAVIN